MADSPGLTRRCAACGYRFEGHVQICPVDNRKLPPPDDAAADLGSYRLLERLGEGGMGAVYRAVHRKLGRQVAIKVLQRDLTNDRGIINRFFHEARAANTIRHDNVIEVHDFVEDLDDVYFVMELLRGRDLHDTIHRRPAELGPIEPERAVLVIEQIAAGLHATHARSIVHRDLKPENVFLCHHHGVDDFVKILDFGVAKLDRPDGLSTVDGAVLGTPEYIAPEQARGLTIDGRADIYSLGCVAYEMLTRHQVFGGGTRSDVLTRQIKVDPPPLRRFVPELPPALDDAVLQALAKDARARPATARLFAESLAHALGRPLRDPGAFDAGDRAAAARPRRPSAGLVLRAPPPPASQQRARVARWALGSLTAALFAGAIFSVQRQRTTPAYQTSSPAGTGRVTGRPEQPGGAPAPLTVTVLLQSTPSGAEVAGANGASIGATPMSWVVPAGAQQVVSFRKTGFAPVTRQFQASSDTTVAVRLVANAAAPTRRAGRGKPARAPAKPARLDSVAGTMDPFTR
ncbi:MAG TPA: protein kinase [Polyangia bacterium]|nr:protein kinase [Polyangia bacterium]